jgi:hypothetical protein
MAELPRMTPVVPPIVNIIRNISPKHDDEVHRYNKGEFPR